MNAVGMVADGSHCGARTGLETCDVSEHPVIYSHSNLKRYPLDRDELNMMIENRPELFRNSYTRWGPINFMPAEGLLAIEGALGDRGYDNDTVAQILGGNFRRVAAQVWQ